MPVDFKQGGDTGLAAAAASIQPITNGEPINQVTLRRPDENLRVRTETLKTAVLRSESRETAEDGSYITSLGGGCVIESVDTDDAGLGQPSVTTRLFYPDVDTALVVASASIAGGKVVLRRADFDSFYSEAAFGDHALIKQGDTLALKFPRSGSDTRTAHTWGNDVTYPEMAGGNLEEEAQLVKLPSRVVIRNTGSTLLTDLGPEGLEYFDADGVPENDNQMYLGITSVSGQAATWWADTQGGRGTVAGEYLDYLEISKITETTIEVISVSPFRVLWPSGEANITWKVYSKSVATYTQRATGSAGHTEEKDFSEFHIVPIVTYTGEGFVFSPNGGYIPDLAPRLLSFTLPISNVADLASTAAADEGTAAIGSKIRSSSGDVSNASYINTNGGVQIIAGTLSAQLDSLVHKAAKRTRAMLGRAASGAIVDGASTSKFFELSADGHAYLSTKERIVRVWFNLETAIVPSSGTLTLSIGAYRPDTGALIQAFLAEDFSLIGMLPGLYEVPISAAVYAYAPSLYTSSGPKLRFKITGSVNLNVTGSMQVGAMVREVD